MTPAPRPLQTPLTIGEGTLSWLVYPVETTLAEKLHTLVSRGSANSRAKDVYDLFLLLPRAKPESLKEALTATFAYRATPLRLPLSAEVPAVATDTLERGWPRAVAGIAEAPTFAAAYAAVLASLRSAGL